MGCISKGKSEGAGENNRGRDTGRGARGGTERRQGGGIFRDGYGVEICDSGFAAVDPPESYFDDVNLLRIHISRAIQRTSVGNAGAFSGSGMRSWCLNCLAWV